MKVFVATKEGQGLRQNDFSHAEEGELVLFSYGCDRDKDNVDGGCGCRRSMDGFKTLSGTTTFKVVDMEMTFPNPYQCTRESYPPHLDGKYPQAVLICFLV